MAGTRRVAGWATIALVAALMAGLLVATFLLGQSRARPSSGVKVTSSNPTVTQLQRVGELVVLRASVADVLATTGYEYRMSLLVKGDALVAVDMRKAEFQSVDPKAKKIVVSLPAPKVIQPRVDHEKTMTWDVEKATWKAWVFLGDEDRLRDETMRDAQRLVYKTCTGQDMMEQARTQTEVMLKNMYRFLGWKVDIVWQEDSEDARVSN